MINVKQNKQISKLLDLQNLQKNTGLLGYYFLLNYVTNSQINVIYKYLLYYRQVINCDRRYDRS